MSSIVQQCSLCGKMGRCVKLVTGETKNVCMLCGPAFFGIEQIDADNYYQQILEVQMSIKKKPGRLNAHVADHQTDPAD